MISKKTVIGLMIIGCMVLVAATWQIVTYAPIVSGSCSESDGGANWGVQGYASALMTGITNSTTTNGTQLVSFADTCRGGDLLYESVCGASYGYPTLAGILSLNCSSLGNYSCLNGACVPTPTNALPDLILLPAGYAYGTVTLNGTILYTVNINANLKNNGNAIAGNSTTRISVGGNTINLNSGPIIPGQLIPLYNNFFQLTSGNYTATITADVNGNVIESNEFNNVYSLTLNLP